MTTAALAIQDAIVAALLSPVALADGRVWPNRLRPLPAGQSSAVVVRLVASQADPDPPLGSPLDWRSFYSIECLARAAAANADPVAALDPLLSDTYARLSAPALTTALSALGVMDSRMEPSIRWDVDEAEQPVASASFRFVVHHRTASDSLIVA